MPVVWIFACMWERKYMHSSVQWQTVTRSIIILVAGTIGCHGFPAVKERLWIPFQHCAMLTSQRELENNTINTSSTVVKIWDFRKPGGLAITTDFMWKALRFFSCFPNSLPESVVAFSVVKLLQDVIWIFIVISILCLDKEKPVSLKKKTSSGIALWSSQTF